MAEADCSPTGQPYYTDYTEEVNHYYADESAASQQEEEAGDRLEHRVRRVHKSIIQSLSLVIKYLFLHDNTLYLVFKKITENRNLQGRLRLW